MPTRFGRFISGKLFSKIFLVLYTAFICLAAYVTNESICLLTGRPHLFGTVYVVFVVFGVLMIAPRNHSAKRFDRFMKKTTSFVSCFSIYYFFLLLLWIAVSIAADFSEKAKAIGVCAAFCVSALIVLLGYLNTKWVSVRRYDISLKENGSEYTVALMSDLHFGIFVGENHAARIVKKVNSLKPDVIAIAGDLLDGDNCLLGDANKMKRISKILRKMKARDGVYAVAGNHDPKTDNKAFRRFLKEARITLLDDEVKILPAVNLIGRTDSVSRHREALAHFEGKSDVSKPIIVLDHKPEAIRDDIKLNADLVLCGHTHRGQLFPMNIFTKWANGKQFFYGHGRHGKTHSIVTSGAGFFALPVRVGTNNEIADIHLLL